MNDKVVSLTGTVKEQQLKTEGLTEHVISLEATLELMPAYRQRHEKLPR
ncbi:hypothetical protein [Burkholderia sp. S171]|nr:hypothetical protein [Burkholderia sp. S171]